MPLIQCYTYASFKSELARLQPGAPVRIVSLRQRHANDLGGSVAWHIVLGA